MAPWPRAAKLLSKPLTLWLCSLLWQKTSSSGVLRRAEFKEMDTLGHGNFSKVFRCKHRLDGVEYAVKRSLKEVLDDASKRQFIQARS